MTQVWKILLAMFPIWVTCIMLFVIYVQLSTMFDDKGITLDIKIGS